MLSGLCVWEGQRPGVGSMAAPPRQELPQLHPSAPHTSLQVSACPVPGQKRPFSPATSSEAFPDYTSPAPAPWGRKRHLLLRSQSALLSLPLWPSCRGHSPPKGIIIRGEAGSSHLAPLSPGGLPPSLPGLGGWRGVRGVESRLPHILVLWPGASDFPHQGSVSTSVKWGDPCNC